MQTAFQQERSLPAHVLRVKPQARCSMDNGATWRQIKRGDLLWPGSLIQMPRDLDACLTIAWWQRFMPTVVAGGDKGMAQKRAASALRVTLRHESKLKIEESARVDTKGDESRGVRVRLDLRSDVLIVANVGGPTSPMDCQIKLRDCVVRLQDGVYALNADGRVSVWRGRASVYLPRTGRTEVVNSQEVFDCSSETFTPCAAYGPGFVVP